MTKSGFWRSIGLTGLFLLGLAGPVNAESWIKVQSAHFEVYSSAPEKTTRDYVRKLEAFRNLTNILLGSTGAGPQVRFTIYLLNNPDKMQSVRPSFAKQVAGVYMPCVEGLSAYATVQKGGDLMDDQDVSLVILFHEYSHYIMFQHAKTYYPTWYVEGFAEYLSTAYPNKGKITIGELSNMRMSTLAEDRWIGFERVLNPEFEFTGDKKNDAWEMQSFYAQSWLLTHYMLNDPGRAKALNLYFAELTKGTDPIQAWEGSTGIKVNSLRGLLKSYYSKMYYMELPVPEYSDSDITVEKLSPETNTFLFDRSLLMTCMEPSQGKDVLGRLTALKPSLGGKLEFDLTLGRAQLLFGPPEDAEATIGAIVDAHPESFEANYLMGRIYFKQSLVATGQDERDLTDASNGFFAAAYTINKLDAPNLYYFARSLSDQPGFPNASAVNAANGAHVLAPNVGDFAVFAAFVNLSTDKRNEAIALLMPFASDPHNPDQAKRFQTAIEAIKAGEPTHKVMSALNGPS